MQAQGRLFIIDDDNGMDKKAEVKMIKTKKNGSSFELAQDSSLPFHLIYLDFQNIEIFKKQYLERFQ